MSVTLQHSVSELDQMITDHLHRPVPESGQRICTRTIEAYSRQLKADYGIGKGPVIMSGHQPIFYHPGIFAKDALVQALARRHAGTAVSLILDTDQESVDFAWPAAARPKFVLSDVRHIMAGQELSSAKKRQLGGCVDQALADLSRTLTPVGAQRARPYLFHLRSVIEQADDIVSITNSVRQFHAERNGWSVIYVKASDLVRTPAFCFFASEVCRRPEEFRLIFNQTLAQYRLKHEIKNHAQPFPDLKEAELPFWFSEHGNRRPLTDDDLRKCGFTEQGKDAPAFAEYFRQGHILPRAITLSLFLRLFLCDLFVHGTGGGRYDRITETVIERFFRCHAAPITVATATLRLEARADFALQSRSLEELHRAARRLHYDPVLFLPGECALHEERKTLIQLQRSLAGAKGHRFVQGDLPALENVRPTFAKRLKRLAAQLRKPESNPPAILHREFAALRRRTGPYLKRSRRLHEDERKRLTICTENQKLFGDRTLPFFFYDLSEIDEAVKPYGQKRND